MSISSAALASWRFPFFLGLGLGRHPTGHRLRLVQAAGLLPQIIAGHGVRPRPRPTTEGPILASAALPVQLFCVAQLTEDRMVPVDRKSTRLNSSHGYISYSLFSLEK